MFIITLLSITEGSFIL